MTRSRWIGFGVWTCVMVGAGVGCSDWFGNDLNKFTPPADASHDGSVASDAPAEAAPQEGGGEEGGGGTDAAHEGGNDAAGDTGTDAGGDGATEDASDGAIEDADVDG